MLHHHLGLLLDVVRMEGHELGQRSRRLLLRQLRIVFRRLQQAVVGLVRRVILQNIEDEFLLDRLPHAVEVKRLRLAARAHSAEQFKRFALGRRGESKEAQIRLLARATA